MVLTENEIRALLTRCRLRLEEKYRGKLDGDEYFKRGFLLGCLQIEEEFVKMLCADGDEEFYRLQLMQLKSLGD
jgi:hypothetical protein